MWGCSILGEPKTNRPSGSFPPLFFQSLFFAHQKPRVVGLNFCFFFGCFFFFWFHVGFPPQKLFRVWQPCATLFPLCGTHKKTKTKKQQPTRITGFSGCLVFFFFFFQTPSFFFPVSSFFFFFWSPKWHHTPFCFPLCFFSFLDVIFLWPPTHPPPHQPPMTPRGAFFFVFFFPPPEKKLGLSSGFFVVFFLFFGVGGWPLSPFGLFLGPPKGNGCFFSLPPQQFFQKKGCFPLRFGSSLGPPPWGEKHKKTKKKKKFPLQPIVVGTLWGGFFFFGGVPVTGVQPPGGGGPVHFPLWVVGGAPKNSFFSFFKFFISPPKARTPNYVFWVLWFGVFSGVLPKKTNHWGGW